MIIATATFRRWRWILGRAAATFPVPKLRAPSLVKIVDELTDLSKLAGATVDIDPQRIRALKHFAVKASAEVHSSSMLPLPEKKVALSLIKKFQDESYDALQVSLFR